MSFTIRQATKDDIDTLVDIYLDSFNNEIFSRQIFPRTAHSSTEYWKKCYTKEIDEPNATFLLLIDSSTSPETAVGFIKWVSPDAPWHDADDGGYPEEGLPKVATQYYKDLFAIHRRLMEGRRHWYLDMMGVRRKYTGKGGATQLVDWGFEKAKRDRTVVFVESVGEAKTFYERFGFKSVETLVVDTPEGKAETFFMVARQ